VDHDPYVHCPNCLAEYRWGISICTECGSQVVPGPSPAMEDGDEDADLDTPEGDGDAGDVEVVRLPADTAEAEDLFDREARPSRVILCLLPTWEAEGLVAALADEGIGAKLEPTEVDDASQVIVHEPRLGDAQAIMVDFTGDPSLVDYVEFEDAGAGGIDDPDHAGFVEVLSGPMLTIAAQAERLREAGVPVRVALPPEGSDPSAAGSVLVAREDLEVAREVLGMEV
jgi:hypothetical protein